jgi:hypothetical protein
MKRSFLAASLATALAAVVAALASTAGVASGESPEGYLHNLAAPPLCAVLGDAPDASLPVCQARFFGPPRVALTSQSVLLRIGDSESSQADCEAFSAGVTTEFRIDGDPVSITTHPCRYVPQPVDNLEGSLPVIPVWVTEFRYLIPAGALAPGVHTVTWTATYNVDVSYSLGCTDPSGRCTTPAGTVVTSTKELTITV